MPVILSHRVDQGQRILAGRALCSLEEVVNMRVVAGDG
jgi:hypothetical protein